MHHLLQKVSIGLVSASILGIGMLSPFAAANSSIINIDEIVNARTTLATLQQTVALPPGTFTGTINANSGKLKGALDLPPATTTIDLAGIGVADATISLLPTKPVVGTSTYNITLNVTAIATFNVKIDSLRPLGLPVNLVGSHCMTKKPVRLKFTGQFTLELNGSASGVYTIPQLSDCGVATAALNAVVPGPNNTFSATLTPAT